MITPARTTAALAAVALAVAAAGCGEKREAGTGTSTAAGGATVTEVPADTTVDVTETEFKIDPPLPKVAKAGVIAFAVKNEGKVDHAIEIEMPGGEIDTDSIAPGESETIKADLKPGTYEWYCPLADHKDRGMKGEIVVAGKSGSGSGSGSKSPGGY